jgi:hypothetical protein
MSLHLEVEHLGGEPVTIDLDDVRMILLESHQLGHGQGTVLLAPDPDLLFALQHAGAILPDVPLLWDSYMYLHPY